MDNKAQEPVAYLNPNDNDRRHAFMWNTGARDKEKYTEALYTHPAPSREPLSGEIVSKIFFESQGKLNQADYFARAIEKAHGIGVEE